MRTTRPSDLYFKVINAVINTLRNGDSVAYVSGGEDGSGFGTFFPSSDFLTIRKDLLNYAICEDINIDEDDFGTLFNEWSEYDGFDSSFDFYELSSNGHRLQLMVNPTYYVNSHELRDMIEDDYPDLSGTEITSGTNGFPCDIRGAVVGFTSWNQAAELSDLYGASLVVIRIRDGWKFYEKRGTIYEDFDLLGVYEDDPNYFVYTDPQDFADVIDMVMADTDEEDEEYRASLKSLCDTILGIDLTNKMLLVSSANLHEYEVLDRFVPHYRYDVWNYEIALDCMINI